MNIGEGTDCTDMDLEMRVEFGPHCFSHRPFEPTVFLMSGAIQGVVYD